jgi:putative tryptophan/tyrosine transport system substrate-binding protein
MKLNKTTAIVFYLFIFVTYFIGCSKSTSEKQYSIGIAILMSHPALDTVISSMKEELRAKGYIEGENTQYILKNANGQINLTPVIAQNLSNTNLDVIVAITTPMAQAIAKMAQIPVVFSAVTDPVGAGIVEDLSKGQKGITGVSDAWPYEAQISLIGEIVPDATIIGVLYNPSEAASQYGIKQIRKIASEKEYKLIEAVAHSTSEVYTAASSVIGSIDVLYLSSDNTVIEGVAGAIKVAIEAKKPLIVGDSGTVAKGGLAAVSVGYAGVGKETGILVDRFLRGENEIPTVVAKGNDIFLNKEAAKLMGIKFTENLIKKATKVYDSIE